MLIGQLARESGVSVRSIRYYEKKHLIESRRLANGYRDYEPQACLQVKVIKTCLGLGFSLKETALILSCTTNQERGQVLCSAAIEIYQQRLSEVNRQIETLLIIRQHLEDITGEGSSR